MTNPHTHETPVVADSLFEGVAVRSKQWHPAIVDCLSRDTGQGLSDLERRLDKLERAGGVIEYHDPEALRRIPIRCCK